MDIHSYTLTKSDYKIIRELLSVALEREFVQGLEQTAKMIEEWRAERPESARDHYHKVINDLKDHRKKLAWTYDDLNKIRSEMSVVALLGRGVLTEADIPATSIKLKEYLLKKRDYWLN